MPNASETISRVHRSKEEAKTSYNQLSRWYDLVSGSSEKKYRDLGLKKLKATSGEQILEIGYGTGHCMLTLAQAVGSSGKVCGIDLSEGMRAISQARINEAGLSERVDLRIGDATFLPFEVNRFDAVFTSFTLELFDTPEIPLVLKQCRQVLRPGGRIVVVCLAKKAGVAVDIYEWFHEKMPTAVDCRPILAQSDLIEAGFSIREVDSLLMWGLPVEIILAAKEDGPA